MDQIKIEYESLAIEEPDKEIKHNSVKKYSAAVTLTIDQIVLSEDWEVQNGIDKVELAKFVIAFIQDNSHYELEVLAVKLAEHLLQTNFSLREVNLELAQNSTDVSATDLVSTVSISRKWEPAVIAFGTNIGDREGYINAALNSMDDNSSVRRLATSSIIETPPYGFLDQDDFLNGAVYIETLLSPLDLLSFLQQLERDAGRKRIVHWGPRSLDLDIIYYSDLILNSKKLMLPHPGLHERRFVLEPLCEIVPNYVDPRFKLPVLALLERFNETESKKTEG